MLDNLRIKWYINIQINIKNNRHTNIYLPKAKTNQKIVSYIYIKLCKDFIVFCLKAIKIIIFIKYHY